MRFVERLVEAGVDFDTHVLLSKLAPETLDLSREMRVDLEQVRPTASRCRTRRY
jgi:hypothetical protein